MMRYRNLIAPLLVVSFFSILAIAYSCNRRSSDPSALAGVDADHDGVRDDVEAFIEKQYSDEKVRIIARELHRGMQDTILHPDTWDQKKSGFPVDCLSYVAPELESQVVHDIEAITVNTRARIRAYWKGNARDSGTILPRARSKEEACGFDSRLLDKQ